MSLVYERTVSAIYPADNAMAYRDTSRGTPSSRQAVVREPQDARGEVHLATTPQQQGTGERMCT